MIVVETFSAAPGRATRLVRTRDQDRGAHDPQQSLIRIASPPEALAAGDRPITPSSARSYDPDRRSRRHRRARAPEIALLATLARDLSADQAVAAPPSNPSPTPPPAVGNHQIPIDPKGRVRPPRVPSLEAFGRRPSALPATSRPAGIRNPSQTSEARHVLRSGGKRAVSGHCRGPCSRPVIANSIARPMPRPDPPRRPAQLRQDREVVAAGSCEPEYRVHVDPDPLARPAQAAAGSWPWHDSSTSQASCSCGPIKACSR